MSIRDHSDCFTVISNELGYFAMTFFDFGALFGSLECFLSCSYLHPLFPAISIAEVKPILYYGKEEGHHG